MFNHGTQWMQKESRWKPVKKRNVFDSRQNAGSTFGGA
jgi:hypothetical protein